MLQYIFNATAIWLISLACFDLLLKRESYHAYNRAYLLVTFLMGLLLPFWQWNNDTIVHRVNLEQAVESVASTRQRIVDASTASASVSWQQGLTVLYLLGLAIALFLFIADIARLVSIFVKGHKTKQDNWTVIKTNSAHAPFSIFNTLFVSQAQQYTADEWNMILAHERRHTTLLHFADLLLMQLSKIVFWFHPLVYVYNSRLMLVHEYQADSASINEPSIYGRFLVEQAVLQAAPSITHSFNRSSIKNRIVMLTRSSSAVSKSKILIVLPLLFISAICFSKNAFAAKFERNGKYVTYNGNKFELTDPKVDTMILTDPVTGVQTLKIIRMDPVPVKLNGMPIQGEADQEPYFTGSDKNLRAYFLKNIKTDLAKLDDGEYSLSFYNTVIDQNGKIVYFDCDDIKRVKTTQELNAEKISGQQAIHADISKPTQEKIYQEICRLADKAPAYIPAKVNGKKVAYTFYDINFMKHFKVKDHKLYDIDKAGNLVEL